MNTKFLESQFILHKNKIEEWIHHRYNNNITIYSSVDLRQSSFKIAPIDTNIFPSGFRFIPQQLIHVASKYFSEYFKKKNVVYTKIAIFAENFTRDRNYWINIKQLVKIFEKISIEVKIIVDANHSIIQKIKKNTNLDIYQATNKNNYIYTEKGWKADVIILNNDFTSHVSPIIQKTKTLIFPQTYFAWCYRSKYSHCLSYNKTIKEFFADTNIMDPWFISTCCDFVDQVNFMKKENFELLSYKVNKLLIKIKKKYTLYSIDRRPYVIIKSDRGTTGRGVITVENTEEITSMNRKQRKDMYSIKLGVKNEKVIVQEGIESALTNNEHPGENTFNIIDNKIISIFTRYNIKKCPRSNLNSYGMKFGTPQKTLYVESVIARLANIAASYEYNTNIDTWLPKIKDC